MKNPQMFNEAICTAFKLHALVRSLEFELVERYDPNLTQEERLHHCGYLSELATEVAARLVWEMRETDGSNEAPRPAKASDDAEATDEGEDSAGLDPELAAWLRMRELAKKEGFL